MVPRGPALGPLFGVLGEELPRMTQRRRRKTALAYLRDRCSTTATRSSTHSSRAPCRSACRCTSTRTTRCRRVRSRRLPEARYHAIYARMASTGLRVRMSSQARIEPNGGCGTLVALHAKRARAHELSHSARRVSARRP